MFLGFIVPSAETLATRGTEHLEILIESVNEGWNNSIPPTRIRPQFADVFCFFSNDIGGLRQVASNLAIWLEDSPDWALAAIVRPKLVVVTETISVSEKSEKRARLEFLRLLREQTGKDILARFSSVEIIGLFPRGTLSIDARHRRSKERLLHTSDQVQDNRIYTQTLFSATHFAALLDRSYQHFATTADIPLNLIQESRAYNTTAADLDQHIRNLIELTEDPADLITFAAPVIGSSFFNG
jgi:hypothetical protein